MGQNLVSKELREFNVGEQTLKKYTHTHLNIHVTTGDWVICEIYIPSIVQYKGIVLGGYWSGGGGNTASSQHQKQEFTIGIHPYVSGAAYRIFQDRAVTNMKLKVWQNNSNSNLFRFTMNCASAYKSWTLVFWEHPVNDYYSNPKGITVGDEAIVADMTGWTNKATGI